MQFSGRWPVARKNVRRGKHMFILQASNFMYTHVENSLRTPYIMRLLYINYNIYADAYAVDILLVAFVVEGTE